jgi:hypothetical protein
MGGTQGTHEKDETYIKIFLPKRQGKKLDGIRRRKWVDNTLKRYAGLDWERGYLSGIALGYGLDNRVLHSRQRLGIFLFTTASRTALGPTQPPTQWVLGALSLGVNLPGSKADHSPPSSAKVKNAMSYIFTSQYSFMAWCSVIAQWQLYLYL